MVLPGSVTAGIPANMSVTVSTAACILTSWIDFDVNGVFDNPAEQLNITACPTCTGGVPGVSPQLPVGTHTLTFDVPAGAAPGASYARFRCATTAVNTPLGSATNGEVEDYPITIVNAAVDWGDLPTTAPSTAFPTLAAANGPRHVMTSNLYLGQCVDAEGNGVPSAQANGDDAATGTIPAGFPACHTAGDDEDGVTLVTPLIAGNQACVAVTTNNTVAGVLQGWIDFDGSGAFDASEALAFAGGGAVPSGVVSSELLLQRAVQRDLLRRPGLHALPPEHDGRPELDRRGEQRRGRGLLAAASLRRQLRLARHERRRHPERARHRRHQRRRA